MGAYKHLLAGSQSMTSRYSPTGPTASGSQGTLKITVLIGTVLRWLRRVGSSAKPRRQRNGGRGYRSIGAGGLAIADPGIGAATPVTLLRSKGYFLPCRAWSYVRRH